MRCMAPLPFGGFAPVGGVGYEVEDCFGGVGEGCFGGYAEFTQGFLRLEGCWIWEGVGSGNESGELEVVGISGCSWCRCIRVPNIDAMTRENGVYGFAG